MSKKLWVRVAGNAANIKASHPYGWRCFIGGDPKEIPLKEWVVNGQCSQKNFIPGVNATGDENGLVAWIDFFGSFSIEDGVLRVNLAMPPGSE